MSARCSRGQGPAAADRVADAEDGPDFDRDILGRGDAGQLDDVDHRLRRVPGERVRQPRLAQAAGADDGHHPGAGHQGPQPGQVGVPADQLGRLVAHSPADRAVEREQARGACAAAARRDPRRAARAGPGGSARNARARPPGRSRRPRCAAGPRAAARRAATAPAPPRAPAARPRAHPPGWRPGPGSPARRPRPRRRPAGPPRAGRRPRQRPRTGRPSAPGPPAPALRRRPRPGRARPRRRARAARAGRCRPRPARLPAGSRRRRGRSRPARTKFRARDTSTCRLFMPLLGASSPQTSSISSSGRTGRQSRAARAASSACGRSPATSFPRQRTSASRVRAMLTGSV